MIPNLDATLKNLHYQCYPEGLEEVSFTLIILQVTGKLVFKSWYLDILVTMAEKNRYETGWATCKQCWRLKLLFFNKNNSRLFNIIMLF